MSHEQLTEVLVSDLVSPTPNVSFAAPADIGWAAPYFNSTGVAQLTPQTFEVPPGTWLLQASFVGNVGNTITMDWVDGANVSIPGAIMQPDVFVQGHSTILTQVAVFAVPTVVKVRLTVGTANLPDVCWLEIRRLSP
jgi:hypothetical protein